MPAWVLPAIGMGLSTISGWLNNRKQKQTSAPTVSPELSPLQQTLTQAILARMRAPSALPAGYETGQIRNINNTFGLANQTLANRLTASGLAASPVAGAGAATMEAGRAGQIATMQAGLPMLEDQMRRQDMGLASNLLAANRGTEVTAPSNQAGGAFQSAADMLAFLYGTGALGGGAKQPLKGKSLNLNGWGSTLPR